jgi:hypothetical protein
MEQSLDDDGGQHKRHSGLIRSAYLCLIAHHVAFCTHDTV